MKREIVEAESVEDAKKLCPWASVIVEVNDQNGNEGGAWICFECNEDAAIWEKQI